MNDKNIDSILEKYPVGKSENLIFILQEVQDLIGYISIESVEKISKYLSLPTVKIYGVATFYDEFRFNTNVKYTVKVCEGTSCHLNKSSELIEEIKYQLSLINGSKEEEQIFCLQIVPCMCACDKGPVFTIENEYYTFASPEIVKPALDKFIEKNGI